MRWNLNTLYIPLILSLSLGVVAVSEGSAQRADSGPDITSRVVATEAGERILIEEVQVEASVGAVWRSYTTNDGWTGWASPLAEIDLRVGGTIRTHYTIGATIGDPGTNVLHIVNYVPERVLTLQAEVGHNWPEIMKEDAQHLMNVIVFEAQGENRTRILSYGVGYRDTPAYEELLGFFVPANEGLYRNLKAFLEDGRRVVHQNR